MSNRKVAISYASVRLVLICSVISVASGQFFFPCQHSGSIEPDSAASQQATFAISGNPAAYTPRQIYEVAFNSSQQFNYLIITGVVESSVASSSGDTAANVGFQCANVHTSVDPVGKHQTNFYWIAPASGTGCISMVAKAFSGHNVLYSDIPVYKICEVGTVEARSDTVSQVSTPYILRDEFDSGSFSDQWGQDRSGVAINNQCGAIVQGSAAIFCDAASSQRHLATKPLNLTSAATLQFVIGSGTCKATTNRIKVSYRVLQSGSWTVMKSITVPGQGSPASKHVVDIPLEARKNSVELKFFEATPGDGCWGVDNVLIVNDDNRPNFISDDFDPSDPGNWLLMTSAGIKADQCSARSNALLFGNTGRPACVTTRDIDLSDETPSGSGSLQVLKSGGRSGTGICGHAAEETVTVFEGAGNRTYCTAAGVDLSGKDAAKFLLGIGSGNCSRSTSHRMDVKYYYVINGVEHSIRSYHFDSYRIPKQVLAPIPHDAQVQGAQICLAQRFHGGEGQNVWTIGSFELVDTPLNHRHYAQFSINMACKQQSSTARVKLQYSTDLGRTWSLLQTECLPEVCQGKHWLLHSQYDSISHEGWTRVTVPLPASALSSSVRFRWIETSTDATSQWAIDEVYIGSDENCPRFCSGHGRCTARGCSCDVGYSGTDCGVIEVQLPDILSETFNDGRTSSGLIEKVTSGEINFKCGIVGSSTALVFDGRGKRQLITKYLNGTNLRYLQFTILMGRHSNTGSCRPPTQPGDGVIVEYSTDSGTTWKFLHLIPYMFEREPKVHTMHLPTAAKQPGLQLRWMQPGTQHRVGDAVWAVDDVLVTSRLFKTAYSTSVNFHLGSLQPYCYRPLVLAFTSGSSEHENQVRFAETRSFHIAPGYVLQAEIVIGCESLPRNTGANSSSPAIRESPEIDTNVELQYSVDHGKTWHLVHELTTPGVPAATLFQAASRYHSSEFGKWTLVTVTLPEQTWSDFTRIRVAQHKFDERVDSWAVDNVYMGPACPMHCRNHGMCRNGVCICNQGHFGETCMPDKQLPVGLDEIFEDVAPLRSRGWTIIGAHVVGDAIGSYGFGCDRMTSENYLHFDKAGVRKLETPDIDSSQGGEIQFYVQIGGGKCDPPRKRTSGVLLQYSTDGGITWSLVQELYYSDFSSPSFVNIEIPADARTSHTRFRWWQPENDGRNMDRWSIDHVVIGERMMDDYASADVVELPPASALKAQDQKSQQVTSAKTPHYVLSNEGVPSDFCSPRKGSFAFNKLKGDRFLMTDAIYLVLGDVIQFELNIGCSRNFSYKYPVKLEYSQDGGYSWDYVRHACYQSGRFLTRDDSGTHTPEDITSHLCTGDARELNEASRYHVGDFDQWTAIIIPVSEAFAGKTVRFRWLQQVPQGDASELPADWAIDSIYIGPKCPKFCLGLGLCAGDATKRQCTCSDGFYENENGYCSPNTVRPHEMWERFLGALSPEWWKRSRGAVVGTGCGTIFEDDSLYFGGKGTRKLETKSLDTTNTRLIQFYLRIGTASDDAQCILPSSRNDGVIFQYSLNNGVTWELIKEFSFDAYFGEEAPLVTMDLPHGARSTATVFRWWQPLLNEKYVSAQWAIDDIIFRADRMSDNGFFEDFEGDDYDDFGEDSEQGGDAGNLQNGYDSENPDGKFNEAANRQKRQANNGDSRGQLFQFEHYWYRAKGATLGTFIGCETFGPGEAGTTAIIFSAPEVTNRYVETWDYYLHSGSFLQFDLIISCESSDPQSEYVRVEFSTDLGKTWQNVVPQCLPGSSVGCKHGFGTNYFLELNKKWTRHNIKLPESVRKSRVRFRWIQNISTGSQIQWGLDNVYLGAGCPWMCGGHGYCEPSVTADGDQCRCDPDFDGSAACQPMLPLPSLLKDDFNHPWDPLGKYTLVVGRDPVLVDDSTSVGVMVDKENLQFSQAGVRLLQTTSLNTTTSRYLQFFINYQGSGGSRDNVVVVQSSINNGITWDTLELIEASPDLPMKFVNIKLPKEARFPNTVFRWWMSNLGAAEGEDIWAIEHLVIGGRSSSCDAATLLEDFDTVNPDNWLFVSGGTVGAQCGTSSSGRDDLMRMVQAESANNYAMFDSVIDEHALVTRDMCVVKDDYVIQFKLKIGCNGATPSALDAVKLEFSTDDGVTWSLVVPPCHGNDADPAGCSFERHQASIYYPGSFDDWRRVVVPLRGKDHICSSNAVRFRWYQQRYPDHYGNGDVVPWSVDDVYIGPACEQMCNGHGHCSDGGETCVCDEGFTSATCCDVIEGANPTFFKENFEYSDSPPVVNPAKWSEALGGVVTNASMRCLPTAVFLRQSYVMSQSGSRVLATRDIDTREATFAQFYITQDRLNPVEPGSNNSPAQLIYFQYSTDGGLSWSIVDTLPFTASSENQPMYVALPLPEGARANATRFRWWQPSQSGEFELGWAIDHVIVGGGQTEIDDDFSSLQDNTWLELASAKLATGTECCEATDGRCQFLQIGGQAESTRDCGKRWAATTGVDVRAGSFIQFDLWSDCTGVDDRCHELFLEYSIDYGHTWALVNPPCLPSDITCSPVSPGSTFSAELFSGIDATNHRVVIPLPENTWSPETRFRWRQQNGTNRNSWKLDDVYIGSACRRACSGHGVCHSGSCRCDAGWEGVACRSPTTELPIDLKDDFASNYDDVASSQYVAILGAVVDDACGNMGYQTALHFNKDCKRMLVTKPLDTSGDNFAQFKFRFGCDGVAPTNRDQGVMVDFTRNGGVTWRKLAEVYYSDLNDAAGFVNILLPDEAKDVGIQFRWWQPRHGGQGQHDWAIDNLLIAGRRDEKMLSDGFAITEPLTAPYGLYLDREDKDMWQFYDNTKPTSYCGRDDVILAGVQPGLEASVGTKDFIAKPGYIMQYTMAVLCKDLQQVHQPVHVQYSLDYGDSWNYVTPQCVPSDPDCYGGEMTQPTAHFISPNWRRRTIWLPDNILRRPVRFRFFQNSSDVTWALDRLYIGPACPDACSGHGDCMKTAANVAECVCDDGYDGPNCYENHQRKTYLKDTFNSGSDVAGQWNLLEAEKYNTNCGLIMDGHTLFFDGVGPKQAESKDLDLRDARFVEYRAAIGGSHSNCLSAKSRDDGLILQYSTDGGISWTLLHELDFQSHPRNASEGYVKLPLAARTNSTRIRWWQPFVIDRDTGLAAMGETRAGWALDDVYIGGHEVNTPALQSYMELLELPAANLGTLPDESFGFYPNSVVGLNLCESEIGSRVIMWPNNDPNSVQQSLTTRQLLVSSGFMIQFKIKVGCMANLSHCAQGHSIRLEYRENPEDNWQLFQEDCHPNSKPATSCELFTNNDPSIYTLDSSRTWSRITLPINRIESGSTQFRWFQEGGAPPGISWAMDQLYIGKACPNLCSGHGRCVLGPRCICDVGHSGIDCGTPVVPSFIRDFKDNFELPTAVEQMLVAAAIRKGAKVSQKWQAIEGGEVGHGGCGSLRPYGFGRTMYFSQCGRRSFTTIEMDMQLGGYVQYVLQIGAVPPRPSCRVFMRNSTHFTGEASVFLQYTTDNGISWHLLQEHRAGYFSMPRRVSVKFVPQMKTDHTALRWWQPKHKGMGQDQWALDNIEIIMSRENRFLYNLNAPPALMPSKGRTELPTPVNAPPPKQAVSKPLLSLP